MFFYIVTQGEVNVKFFKKDGIEERDPKLKQLTKIVRMIGDLEQELREKASETKE